MVNVDNYTLASLVTYHGNEVHLHQCDQFCDLDYRKEVGMTKFIPKAVLENMKVRFCLIHNFRKQS